MLTAVLWRSTSRLINPFNAKAYGKRQKDLIIQNDLLFIRDMPKNCTESVLLFVMPANKCQVALDLCHHDARHQGRDRTYSLLQERFWWPKMRMQMMNNILNCNKCKVFERKDPKPPLQHQDVRANGFCAHQPVGIGDHHEHQGAPYSSENPRHHKSLLMPRAGLQS